MGWSIVGVVLRELGGEEGGGKFSAGESRDGGFVVALLMNLFERKVRYVSCTARFVVVVAPVVQYFLSWNVSN